MRCIWCKNEGGARSIEHIIPEALGCPDNFLLSNGEVCRKCNNDLAKLDKAIIDDFDFVAFMSGVPRKRGRPPVINSRGNVIGLIGPEGPKLHFNMDRRPVATDSGVTLAPFGGSCRNVNASFEEDGKSAKVSFSTEIGRNPQFARGIVKIAMSATAYFYGAEAVLSPDFDKVRKFVRKGAGRRKIIMLPDEDSSYWHHMSPPLLLGCGGYLAVFRLAVARFIVDLTRDLTEFPRLKEQAFEQFGKTGWTYLPLDT